MVKETSKQKLLIAARKLFVELGYSGTSTAKIAKFAEVNHSLIFHHFGNKEKLWQEVKQKIVAETDKQTKTIPTLNQPFDAFLKELILQNIYFYRHNPDIVKMINWQRLEYTEHQKAELAPSASANAWVNAFKHYQQIGAIDKKLRPEFIVTFVLSIISTLALDPIDFVKDEQNQNDYIDFCVTRLLKSFI